jgi:hypothetical protein
MPEGGDALVTEFGELNLDICTSDTYDVSSLLPVHVVEGSAPISDSQRPGNDTVTFEAYVSERVSDIRTVEGSRLESIELSNGSRASAISVPEGTNRRQEAFDTLRDLCRSGQPIDVTGLRRTIEGWQIESVSSPRTVDDAGALVCQISMKERRVAVLEEVDAPAPRVERGRRNANAGRADERTDGEDTAVPTSTEETSTARGLLDEALDRWRT